MTNNNTPVIGSVVNIRLGNSFDTSWLPAGKGIVVATRPLFEGSKSTVVAIMTKINDKPFIADGGTYNPEFDRVESTRGAGMTSSPRHFQAMVEQNEVDIGYALDMIKDLPSHSWVDPRKQAA